MKTYNKSDLRKEVKKFNGILTDTNYNQYDQSYTIEIEAPDNFQWADSNSQVMICTWFRYVKNDKSVEIENAIERIKCGLEKYTE